jgi:hypothetical protein
MEHMRGWSLTPSGNLSAKKMAKERNCSFNEFSRNVPITFLPYKVSMGADALEVFMPSSGIAERCAYFVFSIESASHLQK